MLFVIVMGLIGLVWAACSAITEKIKELKKLPGERRTAVILGYRILWLLCIFINLILAVVAYYTW